MPEEKLFEKNLLTTHLSAKYLRKRLSAKSAYIYIVRKNGIQTALYSKLT